MNNEIIRLISNIYFLLGVCTLPVFSFINAWSAFSITILLKFKSPSLKISILQSFFFLTGLFCFVASIVLGGEYKFLLIITLVIVIIQRYIRRKNKDIINPLVYKLDKKANINLNCNYDFIIKRKSVFINTFLSIFILFFILFLVSWGFKFNISYVDFINNIYLSLFAVCFIIPFYIILAIVNYSLFINYIKINNDTLQIFYYFRKKPYTINLEQVRAVIFSQSRFSKQILLDIKNSKYIKITDRAFGDENFNRIMKYFESSGLLFESGIFKAAGNIY